MKIPSISIRFEKDAPRNLPWGAFWREPRASGEPKRRKQFFKTEAEADQFKADFEAALKSTATQPPPVVPIAGADTVAAYLASWLAVHIEPKRDRKTYTSYESLVRVHIVTAPLVGSTWTNLVGESGGTFGNLRMKQLRPLVVRALYEDLFTNGMALASRKHVHSCLSSACGYAVRDEVIESNPCLTLGRHLRHKDEQTEDPQPNPFTKDEGRAFLAYVKKHERDWFEYFQFLHDTGVRVGEAAALKWVNVDLVLKRAEIVASFSPAEGKDKLPKTHQRRWIDLSDLVVKLLRELRKRQRIETLRAGRSERKYVFTNGRGTPRRQDGNMRRVFERVCEGCEFNGRRDTTGQPVVDHSPHDLRDTFATIHLSDNYLKLPWVSKQLGHETEQTTVNHYFRYLPSKFTARFANEIR